VYRGHRDFCFRLGFLEFSYLFCMCIHKLFWDVVARTSRLMHVCKRSVFASAYDVQFLMRVLMYLFLEDGPLRMVRYGGDGVC
jgi:hypothetical protein